MGHKVKLVGVKGDVVTLRVDGELCSYLIQRPTPLTLPDTTMLRNVMDTHILESLCQASGLVRPGRSLLRRFLDMWPHRSGVPLYGEAVTNFIERVGVEVNIDEKTKGIVLLKSDVDKIRKGGEL